MAALTCYRLRAAVTADEAEGGYCCSLALACFYEMNEGVGSCSCIYLKPESSGLFIILDDMIAGPLSPLPVTGAGADIPGW